jgi:hypothetical protein
MEVTSPFDIPVPGLDDNPALVNLVFTQVGPDFRKSGGPFTPCELNGLGARSI